MEEDKKLYPMVFSALQDEYSWGSEEFKLADLGYRDSPVRGGWLATNTISEVMETYLDRVVGEGIYNVYGRQFPVCVRHIRCHGRMPLRVHPDDETAAERWDALGKHKVWYVLRAGKDARLHIGFRQQTDASQLFPACLDGSVTGLLNTVAPHAGQCFAIAPGTVHAAEGDIEILEIAQSSAMDFCLCGWGEEVSAEEFDSSLTLVDALDFIDYKAWKPAAAPKGSLAQVPQFKVTSLPLNGAVKVRAGSEECFSLYSCISGEASVQIEVLGQKALFPLENGRTMLVPAEVTEFYIVPTAPGTVLLETVCTAEPAPDSYIDPSAEPTLPGEDDPSRNDFAD